jgi:hypothetical protein
MRAHSALSGSIIAPTSGSVMGTDASFYGTKRLLRASSLNSQALSVRCG